MNLKQAIEQGRLDEFVAEHEVENPHPDGEFRFWKLLALMTGSSTSAPASGAESCGNSDETQTQPNTSEDA